MYSFTFQPVVTNAPLKDEFTRKITIQSPAHSCTVGKSSENSQSAKHFLSLTEKLWNNWRRLWCKKHPNPPPSNGFIQLVLCNPSHQRPPDSILIWKDVVNTHMLELQLQTGCVNAFNLAAFCSIKGVNNLLKSILDLGDLDYAGRAAWSPFRFLGGWFSFTCWKKYHLRLLFGRMLFCLEAPEKFCWPWKL